MNRATARIQAVYPKRNKVHPEMLKRRRQLPAPCRVPYDGPRFEVLWKRSDCTELDLRFAALLMLFHDARTLEVGRWVGNGIQFWDRAELAKRLGEEGLPLSLPQVDRLISRFRAWGWIFRKYRRMPRGQSYISAPSVLKVTHEFLRAWGVLAERNDKVEKYRRREERRARAAGELSAPAQHEVSGYVRKQARQLAADQAELDVYRAQVRRETELREWDLEAEARRRWKRDRGPP